MARLQDKVAIVTGGASGIGRATSTLFAREGAKVVVVDLSDDAGDAVVKEIAGAGGEARFLRADVSRSEDVRRMIASTVEAYGRLDVLFNNAGIEGPARRLADYEEDEWARVIAIDLTAVFLGMKYAIPQMVRQGGGVIVSTASVAGMVGFPASGAYGAAKAGVIQLTRVAAIEYASKNVRVNCICPGIIRTPMAERVMGGKPEDFAAKLGASARFGRPEDIAHAALFLASDESSFANGAPFVIDGGYVAR